MSEDKKRNSSKETVKKAAQASQKAASETAKAIKESGAWFPLGLILVAVIGICWIYSQDPASGKVLGGFSLGALIVSQIVKAIKGHDM